MSLRNILADFAADSGYQTTTENQRERAISLINDAAFEIYRSWDLPNCLQEQVFQLGVTDQMISLPHYVCELRAIKGYDSELKMELCDMRPYYSTQGWVRSIGYRWRVKNTSYPLSKNLLNVEPITITFSNPVPETVSVVLEIKTPKSGKIIETLIFAVGEQSKTTSSHVEQVFSIQKSNVTTYDLSGHNQDGEVITSIPNTELRANFTQVTVLDKFESLGQDRLVTTLFKLRYRPMNDDYDSFVCGDDYDKCIYYKTMEIFYGKQGSADALQQALAFNAKCEQLMTRLTANSESAVKKIIDFGPNRWRHIERKSYNAYYGAGLQSRY